jgi:hypothetical protein
VPPERDEPDIPPDEPEVPEEPDMPEPEEPALLDEPGDALRLLCPLIPERLVSPANSSEADDERLLPDALRELPSLTDWSPRMSRCDEEPD